MRFWKYAGIVVCAAAVLGSPLYGQGRTNDWPLLVGTREGLYGFDWSGKYSTLWTGGSVKKIIKTQGGWLISGGEGILFSRNLRDWENRVGGLPVKTVKVFDGGKKTFLPVIQEIKDLEINPENPDILVCATKDRVYLSRDQGRAWTSLGAPPFRTNGIKAVAAVSTQPGADGSALTVFVSHSVYGIYYMQPDRSGARWVELNGGLETLETTGNADEVSDIAAVKRENGAVEIYVAQTFRHRVYRLDWERKNFAVIWKDDLPFGTVDSLDAGREKIRFTREGEIAEIAYDAADSVEPESRDDLERLIRVIPSSLSMKPDCIVMRENRRADSELISLSELWLLDEAAPDSEGVFAGNAAADGVEVSDNAGGTGGAGRVNPAGRKGLYLPVNHAMDSTSLKPYLDIIESRGLDMVVIDMKDDYGRLRFTPDNPEISKNGRVFRPLDIDKFLADMKARGIYTAARIVVFKDPVLAARNGSKYAVWDSRNNKPWAGYYDRRRKKVENPEEAAPDNLTEIIAADDPEYEIVRTFYDERWVDPYSEEVWEYIAATAAELHERGFDEIQFDYIRFPTDGANLDDARYRWQENGMDMESAILSFLRHIRSRVNAPISIDIYGANGWYRTGARTGQEVELLAPWVDVICPMYYPSHFEQDFLAQPPEEMRPYRIYYQGTLRTARIGRGQVIVRPYTQAFYLNVSYDRKYYNVDYVRRQVEGIRDAGSPGYTHWNNSGRYEDIPFPSSMLP